MSQHHTPDNTYFIIEIVNPMGRRGFAMDTPEGIKFSVGGYDKNTRQFSSREEAQLFVVDNNLSQFGRIFILSNHDIMKKYGKKLEGSMYCIINEKGHHLFYDEKQQGYYFMNRFAGSCCWFNEKEAQTFADTFQEDFLFDKLIVKQIK